MSADTPQMKPFPGHLTVWYEREERRNPGWKDFEPTSRDDASLRGKSTTRRRWDALHDAMQADGVVVVSAARLRSQHFAGRSVVIPAMHGIAAFAEMGGHVARTKTPLDGWQEIAGAWLRKDIRQPVVMDLMLGALVETTPAGMRLYSFASEGWLAKAFIDRGFRVISPNDLPLALPRRGGACYFLQC